MNLDKLGGMMGAGVIELLEQLIYFRMNKNWKDKYRVIELICSNFPFTADLLGQGSFVTPNFVKELLRNVFHGPNIELSRNEYRELIGLAGYLDKRTGDLTRILDFNLNSGNYFNRNVVGEDYAYFISESGPLIVTNVSAKWVNEQGELSVLLRPEVKIISALLASMGGNDYCVQLISGSSIDIPRDELIPIEPFGTEIYLREIFRQSKLYSCLRRDSVVTSSLKREPMFSIVSDDNRMANIRDYLESFNCDDELQLQTAYLFIKCGWLYSSNRLFGHDALVSLYCGLEGALRLIYRKHFRGQFNVESVKKHLKLELGNEYFHDAIDEFYNNRIVLIHPENRIANPWSYFLSADDIYDSYGYLLELFYYSVVGKLPKGRDSN